jgi:hypothetical protein
MKAPPGPLHLQTSPCGAHARNEGGLVKLSTSRGCGALGCYPEAFGSLPASMISVHHWTSFHVADPLLSLLMYAGLHLFVNTTVAFLVWASGYPTADS